MSEANTALPFIMNIMKGVHTHCIARHQRKRKHHQDNKNIILHNNSDNNRKIS